MTKQDNTTTTQTDLNTTPQTPNHVFRTQILLYFGLGGFLLGVFLLFNPRFEYHDIKFSPQAIADTLLARKERSLFPAGAPSVDSTLIARPAMKRIRRNDELDTPFPTDFSKLQPQPVDAVRQKFIPYLIYTRIEQERHRIEDNTDTTLNTRYFVGSLFTADKQALATLYHNGDTSAASRTFCFRYDRDTVYPEFSIHAESEITLQTTTYPAIGIDFFTKYPNFGTFALLMLFQFVAFFIVIPLSVATINDLRAEYAVPNKNVWIAYLLAFGVVIAYAGMIFYFIVKPDYIGDRFFMNGFTTIVGFYYALAYLSAITCYAGYLFTGRLIARKMGDFKTVAYNQRDNIVQQNALTSTARANADTFRANAAPEAASALSASITSTGKDIADNAREIADLADSYKKLRSHFTIFFYTSAFLLSMVVLQTGSLFSAIGSLDLMRFLNAPPGYSVLRNDFVYLLGGLYSILLLIFYVPVKISMINLENQLPDTTVTGTDGKSFLPIFSSGLRTTASVLAASSPFLISIIQYILQSIGSK
jgi:hypothetical protein